MADSTGAGESVHHADSASLAGGDCALPDIVPGDEAVNKFREQALTAIGEVAKNFGGPKQ